MPDTDLVQFHWHTKVTFPVSLFIHDFTNTIKYILPSLSHVRPWVSGLDQASGAAPGKARTRPVIGIGFDSEITLCVFWSSLCPLPSGSLEPTAMSLPCKDPNFTHSTAYAWQTTNTENSRSRHLTLLKSHLSKRLRVISHCFVCAVGSNSTPGSNGCTWWSVHHAACWLCHQKLSAVSAICCWVSSLSILWMYAGRTLCQPSFCAFSPAVTKWFQWSSSSAKCRRFNRNILRTEVNGDQALHFCGVLTLLHQIIQWWYYIHVDLCCLALEEIEKDWKQLGLETLPATQTLNRWCCISLLYFVLFSHHIISITSHHTLSFR